MQSHQQNNKLRPIGSTDIVPTVAGAVLAVEIAPTIGTIGGLGVGVVGMFAVRAVIGAWRT